MGEVALSFIVKSTCDTYLVFTILDGKRINFWKGAFFYIVLIDIAFTIVCAGGMGQLNALLEPMTRPDAK